MKEETPKLCSRCGKNPRMPYQRWCRECHREYSRTYRREHLEECRASARRWYANLTPDAKKIVLQRSKDYHAQCMVDPEKAEASRKRAAEYYQQHKDKLLAYQARYRQEHAKKEKGEETCQER